MGGTNSSLYDGTINFISLVKAQYWTIPMTALGTSTGTPITLSGSNQNAVIDTGTTLIGGPASVLDTFYAQIPGAARGSQVEASLQDYYIIRTLCFGLYLPTLIICYPSSLQHKRSSYSYFRRPNIHNGLQ
jgi:hypothetical protein